MFVSGKFRDGYVVFRKICNFFYFLFLRFSSSPQCLYQGSSATGMWFFGRFVFFYFLFLRFSSSPRCLYQGSSATGMWFSGRFVIFLFPVPPLFFFSAMFVSGKFRNGYVVFRKICDFFYFLFLRFSSSPQCLCQGSSATGMWFSGRFIIFSFSLSSPVPPLLRFPVLPFFSPLFLFFFLCFYIFTFFSACIKKNSFVVVLKTVSRLFNKRQRRFFLEYI